MTRLEILRVILADTKAHNGVAPTAGLIPADVFARLHADGYGGSAGMFDYLMVAGVPLFRGAEGLGTRFTRHLYHEAMCGREPRDGVACTS